MFAGNETTPADDEAFRIWHEEIGIPEDRIFKFGKADNFWEHGSGPCGPCSEIYYDRGEKYGCGKPGCTVGCDCDRYMEVWNVVFSQFDNDGHDHYTELKQKNIDTGMGLERLAVVCQDVDSLFDVDTVMNITNKVTEITGASYGQKMCIRDSTREALVRDRGTLYTVMEAKAGKMELSLSQVWGGIGLAHDPLADRYIVEKIVRTQMALAGAKRSTRLQARTEELREILTALRCV